VAEMEKTAEVLRKISSFLRTLTDDQVDDLITGQVKLTLTENPRRKPYSSRTSDAKPDINRLRQDLESKATREEGIALLDDLALTRESLRSIASALDLPTPRTDTVARLKDRIVDATIGYRLRSDAIRSRG
jgi:hypothetical protein